MSAKITSSSGCRFQISEVDQALLDTVFDIPDPSGLPGLRSTIPPRSDLDIDQVEGLYHIDGAEAERERWIRCCECRTDRNHKHGFVVRFVDGTRATVGRDCAREKHALDYKEYLAAFDKRGDRATRLRQVILATELADGLKRQIQEIREHNGLYQGLRIRHEVETKLPQLYKKLAGATRGSILAMMSVRDTDAEMRRDENLDQKLTRLATRRGSNREFPGADQALLAELRASGDSDAAKEPIMKKEEREIGRFQGHELFKTLDLTRNRLEQIHGRITETVKTLIGKPSISFSDQELDGFRRKFVKAIDDAIACSNDINAALSFANPQNLNGTIQLARRFSSLKDLSFKDGCIVKDSPNPISVDCNLPSARLFPLNRSRKQSGVSKIWTWKMAMPMGAPLPPTKIEWDTSHFSSKHR